MSSETIAKKYLSVPRNVWDGREKIPLDVDGADGVGVASTLRDYILAGTTSVSADLFQVKNTTGEVQFEVESVSNAVNNWRVQGALSGGMPVLVAVGANTNIGGVISVKGTGGFFVGNGSGELFQAVETGAGSISNRVQLRSAIAGQNARVAVIGDTNANLDVAGAGTGFVSISRVTKLPFVAVQVPSGGVNDFDDYEEGQFTPSVFFGGANVGMTCSLQSGSYTKKGREVTINTWIVITLKGSSVGPVTIEGLPFTHGGATVSPCSLRIGTLAAAMGAGFVQGQVNQSTTQIKLEKLIGGAATALLDTDIVNGTSLMVTATYNT